jgi:uncharacterized protein YukE
MSQDLNVDLQALKQTINALTHSQTVMTERFKTLEADWQICDDSWKGNAKDKFEKEITPTIATLRSTIQMGDDALAWLEKFHDLVEEFEQY